MSSFRHLMRPSKIYFHLLLCRRCYSHDRSSFAHAKYLESSYKVLNASESCSDSELREAYLRLVKQYHPDSKLGLSNASKFAEVEKAYRLIVMHRKEMAECAAAAEQKSFDIEHTAPQHRVYLENEGIGCGTPSQRQKQYQQKKVERAVENVFNFQAQKIIATDENSLVAKDKKETKKRTMRSAIDRLVEDLIAESMAKGDFDNLPGKGKPLKNTDYNPYIDSMTHNLNKVLINNGYSPPWITLEKEIRQELTKARERLQSAYSVACKQPPSALNRRLWRQHEAEFRDAICSVNAKINRLNMIVPTLRQQMFHYNADKELDVIKADKNVADTFTSVQNTPQNTVSGEQRTNDWTSLRDVLRELKALFRN